MSPDFREIHLKISTHEAALRLDLYLARQVAHLSRTRIQALLEAGLITLNGFQVKPSHPVKDGEEVLIRIPGPEPSPLSPENIPLDIHYEDEHLIIINKPAGLVVHPAHGHPSGTLVNAVLYHVLSPHPSDTPLIKGGRGDQSTPRPSPEGAASATPSPLIEGGMGGDLLAGGSVRPGLVHRLDKDTSGLLVVAKDEKTLAGLARQFKEKTAERKYRALVWGHLRPEEGRIEAPLGRSRRDRKLFDVVTGGKEAATRYVTLNKFQLFSLVELQLETGRTHQIRIHLQHAHHPVFGDPQYGGRNRRLGVLTSSQRAFAAQLLEMLPRQALHAGILGFTHPITGQNLLFESDFPQDIQAVMDLLRSR